MSPIIFQIGPLSIRWYGVLIMAGVILGLFLAGREAKRQAVNIEFIYNLFFYLLISAIVGARLYYVIFSWGLYRNNMGEIFAFWHGGLAILGDCQIIVGAATVPTTRAADAACVKNNGKRHVRGKISRTRGVAHKPYHNQHAKAGKPRNEPTSVHDPLLYPSLAGSGR